MPMTTQRYGYARLLKLATNMLDQRFQPGTLVEVVERYGEAGTRVRDGYGREITVLPGELQDEPSILVQRLV